MPRRRRTAKRKFTEEQELAAWEGTFDCGADFFQDLEPLGLEIQLLDHADAATRKSAEEAWHRLGARFMQGWQPNTARSRPWALEYFGAP